jgi:xanthine phosphoribosyltransferase
LPMPWRAACVLECRKDMDVVFHGPLNASTYDNPGGQKTWSVPDLVVSLESRMARVAYEDEIIISWVELHRDARFLSEQLHKKGPWKGIIAVTRGGLVPAALVARELDIRLVDTICVTSYESGAAGNAAKVQGDVRVLKGVAGNGEGYLLIDDLVDTGRTAQAVRRLLPKAYFATLYAKPAGRAIVDLFVKEFKQTKWIHFPWDIEYSFATPIKDGGRAMAGP